MCSTHRLMVFNVCVKFHENMSSGFKVMEWTRKIVNTQRAITGADTKIVNRHTHTQKRRKLYTPLHCILRMPGGKPELPLMSSACCSWFNICGKFHENMSSSFKLMERTRKIVNTQRKITLKAGKSEFQFICSAYHLMVFNVCVKFHKYIKRF